PQGDGGDRRGGVCVRRRSSAPLSESRRRETAEATRRTNPHFERRRSGSGRIPGRRAGTNRPAYFCVRGRTLGNYTLYVSRRRTSTSDVGGQRSDPRATRRRAEGVAAPGPRAGTRAE